MTSRLVYLAGQLGPGGAQRQLCYLLQAMDRDRYRPTVIAWRLTNDAVYITQLQNLGIPLYFLPARFPAPGKMLVFRSIVKRLQPEVVHSYSFFTNVVVGWSLQGLPAIRIGSIRNDFTNDCDRAGQVLGRLSARWPRHQICNSVTAKNSVLSSKKFFRPAVPHVVRNALDLETFKVNTVLPAKPTVLALGRLYPQKRWDRFLDVIASVKKRQIPFTVLHAGDGPLRNQLISRARNLQLEDTIHFLGYQRDIPALLASCSFLLHTSDHEGCPNVVMEAMACGRAVVATDAGDTAYLIDDEKTGYVVPKDDKEALVDRTTRLLTHPDLCRQLGQNARLKAEREFGLDRLVHETLAAYRQAGWQDVA